MEFVFLTLRRSMVCQNRHYQRFLENKQMIKAVNFAKGSEVISKQRPQIIGKFETFLLVFINEKYMKA